jgi:NAD(P)H-dependent FMN reductase
MTRILLVCGSQRRDSFNARLLAHLAGGLPAPCVLDTLAPEDVDLPLFDQDREAEPDLVERVATIHARFRKCHGIIVASPEYNGLLTPYLKNLIDWVSRLPRVDRRFDSPFVGRPVLLCSASTGSSGGAVAIPSARALFGYIGCVVIGDTICVPAAAQIWTDAGYRFETAFEARIEAALVRLQKLAHDFAGARQAPLEVAA